MDDLWVDPRVSQMDEMKVATTVAMSVDCWALLLAELRAVPTVSPWVDE